MCDEMIVWHAGHQSKRHETELSKHIWTLKDNNKPFNLKLKMNAYSKFGVDKERVLWYFPLQLIGTPGNFYNGRSRPGDRSRVRHISHHFRAAQPGNETLLKSVSFLRNEMYLQYVNYRINYLSMV